MEEDESSSSLVQQNAFQRGGSRSVLLGQHDGQHAGGDERVGRVRRMPGEVVVVVVDLPDHVLAGGFQAGAVVLAMRVVVGVPASSPNANDFFNSLLG